MINETGTNNFYIEGNGNSVSPSFEETKENNIGTMTQSAPINENVLAQTLNTVTDNHSEIVDLESFSPISKETTNGRDFVERMINFDYTNTPITEIVNFIILDSIQKGASTIHFDPFEEGIRIRLRIDGKLHDYSIVPLYVKRNMITRIKIISGLNITDSHMPQEGSIKIEIQNKICDLQVSSLPTHVGEKIVIRIMDYSITDNSIETLDFSKDNLEKVQKMLDKPNGVVLVTGPIRSGKSTTLYSMLNRLNMEKMNIVTVEDPIEIRISGINQVQVTQETGLTYASTLRSTLRQDPDVIMIGEIRDEETMRGAVRAAVTGRLVLSSVYTKDVLNTIEYLREMNIERYLIGSSLSGIISQRLSRRLCDKCKRLKPTTDYEKNILRKICHQDIEELYEPVGCPECSNGYRGRIAIQEVLLANESIKEAIIQGFDKETLKSLIYGPQGTSPMLVDGIKKVLEGKTSLEEILNLIDLEDDLGNGFHLGLKEQIDNAQLKDSNDTEQILSISPSDSKKTSHEDQKENNKRNKKKRKSKQNPKEDKLNVEEVRLELPFDIEKAQDNEEPSFEDIFGDIHPVGYVNQDEIDLVLKDIDSIKDEMLEEKISLDDPIAKKLTDDIRIKEINDLTNEVFDLTGIIEDATINKPNSDNNMSNENNGNPLNAQETPRAMDDTKPLDNSSSESILELNEEDITLDNKEIDRLIMEIED